MYHSTRATLTLLILSLAAWACAVPPLIPQDPSAINTAAAQTVIAGLTQIALSALPTLTPSDTPIPTLTATASMTFTPAPPTLTPTATNSLTPVFTSTPLYPQLSVSVPTNCRVGPGKVYDRLGTLNVGEIVQVYGRDPSGNYWYIRNPDNSSQFCWVWGEYATLWGSAAAVPILTPPPTPRPTATSTPFPAFRATFHGMGSCNGYWVEIRLANTGTMTFTSMNLTVRDTVTDVVRSRLADNFLNRNGCEETITRDALAPGKELVISSPRFDTSLSGHRLHVNITLCTQANQNGTCVTQTLKFTP